VAPFCRSTQRYARSVTGPASGATAKGAGSTDLRSVPLTSGPLSSPEITGVRLWTSGPLTSHQMRETTPRIQVLRPTPRPPGLRTPTFPGSPEIQPAFKRLRAISRTPTSGPPSMYLRIPNLGRAPVAEFGWSSHRSRALSLHRPDEDHGRQRHRPRLMLAARRHDSRDVGHYAPPPCCRRRLSSRLRSLWRRVTPVDVDVQTVHGNGATREQTATRNHAKGSGWIVRDSIATSGVSRRSLPCSSTGPSSRTTCAP
jgi:hypothetical protein